MLFLPIIAFPQNDTVGKVKYTNDFIFNDGIYKTFQEFKADSPSIRQFTIERPNPYSDPNYIKIKFVCPDSVKNKGNCEVKDLWGYVKNGDVYIAHSYYAYYFKLMVIGSLCHFAGLTEGQSMDANQMAMGFAVESQYQQYMLDFETGNVIAFNYKNFSAFLLAHDKELYDELKNQKKKKKIIFKYLLKYNERHPIWFKQA